MRAIKFRAWLKELNKMENGLFGLRSDGQASFNTDCVLMQFTGLKDKNGKEVYEGDIVKIGGLIELVCYINGILCCYSTDIYGEISVIDFDENAQNAIVSYFDYFTPYEIIGNVYENPELLK